MLWSISDPHLSFGVPNKNMDVFGPRWVDYTAKIETTWRSLIGKEDLVLIAGDISWAMNMEEVIPDLQWIDSLPGTKVMIKGNHDYWWGSTNKLTKIMPPSIHFIQNNVFNWNGVTIGGTRLWDSEEYHFNAFIDFQERKAKPPLSREEWEEKKQTDEKIFVRELERLSMSLKQLDPAAHTRIAMTHYPPIGADLKPTRASSILEQHQIDICVFGHLHSIKQDLSLFGEARGVKYVLTSCDYLNFTPIQINK